MTAHEVIAVAELVAPLDTGSEGAGVDLRQDYSTSSLYQRLRDARSNARAEERARDAEGGSDGNDAPSWREVLNLAEQALSTKTKDLEIAAWMTEALVRLHGFSGLVSGANLLAQLCEKYWETGFPQPDEDGFENRTVPIGGLSGEGVDGTLMQPLRREPLFRRADGSGLGLYQWEQSEQALTLDSARRAARYASGTPELAALESEARADHAFLVATGKSARAAIDAWSSLGKALDTKLGADSPSLRNVTTLLERVLAIVARLGGVVPELEDRSVAVESTPDGAPGVSAGGDPAAAGGAMTRESALRELDRIAEFFRRMEPHSPLSATLSEAVRRGRLSFGDLMTELIPDEQTRHGLLERLGVRPQG